MGNEDLLPEREILFYDEAGSIPYGLLVVAAEAPVGIRKLYRC